MVLLQIGRKKNNYLKFHSKPLWSLISAQINKSDFNSKYLHPVFFYAQNLNSIHGPSWLCFKFFK